MARSFLPLRLKLTLWSVLVFFVILLTLFTGVWIFAETRGAGHDIDAELRAKTLAVTKRLQAPDAALRSRNELDGAAAEVSPSPLFKRFAVRVFTENGTLSSSSSDDTSLLAIPFAKTANRDEVRLETYPVALENEPDARLRVATKQFVTDHGETFYVQLATSASNDEGGLAALQSVALFSFPFGLLAAGIAAWIMAGRVVSPIQRLAKAARAVSPTSLEGRIDVGPADAEIARLQHELNDAFGRLERAYREQGSFISNVSHELKTPIAVLLSQAQVLKQENRSPLEYRRFLAVVEDEMRVLGRLVESFLVLARVGHGKNLVRRERLAVNDVVLEAVEHCAALSRHHEAPLVTLLHLSDDGEPEPEIEGDPELLRTMLENLVRNALRYSPSGEPVDLRVNCNKDRASILVRDRGPGIAPEHIERVFERFYTVTDPEKGTRGSGLGLAIAKSVAELHNGTISVHNCVDRGCEFEVLLPLCKPLQLGESAHTELESAAASQPESTEKHSESGERAAATAPEPRAHIPPAPRRAGLPATE